MATFRENIDFGNLPQHIAVIMDGNGRWAKQKGAARIFGHRSAVQSVKDITEGCGELGIKFLTLYAFSTENWGRPKDEVDGLMELLVNTIQKEIRSLLENQVKLKIIGEIGSLPKVCQTNLLEAVEATKNNSGLNLLLALSYSGRMEIVTAVKKIAEQVKNGTLDPGQVSEQLFEKNLETNGIPDPELLIRTSGELRVSNFLLWQIAYTEFYVTPKLWPDFRKEDLYGSYLRLPETRKKIWKSVDPNCLSLMKRILLISYCILFAFCTHAQFRRKIAPAVSRDDQKQSTLNYSSPTEYTIAGIDVVGLNVLDKNAMISLTGLKIGDVIKIPGSATSNAVRETLETWPCRRRFNYCRPGGRNKYLPHH